MNIDKKTLIEEIKQKISLCEDCSLCKNRKNTVPGMGNVFNQIMFIGEAPGAEEDEQGVPFVGRSGQLLTKIIASSGLTRDDIYITNIVKCRPPENRNPDLKEIKACSKFLNSQIAVINPKIIVTVGSISTKAIIGHLVGDQGITKIRGKIFDWQGIKVIPLLHPSYLLRNPSLEKNKPKWHTWQDILLIKKEFDKIKKDK